MCYLCCSGNFQVTRSAIALSHCAQPLRSASPRTSAVSKIRQDLAKTYFRSSVGSFGEMGDTANLVLGLAKALTLLYKFNLPLDTSVLFCAKSNEVLLREDQQHEGVILVQRAHTLLVLKLPETNGANKGRNRGRRANSSSDGMHRVELLQHELYCADGVVQRKRH